MEVNMSYGLKKQKALKSEKKGLHIHQNKHRATYRRCTTLEQCKAEYVKYWAFVAEEMKTLAPQEN